MVADRGYFSGEQILACEEDAITVTLPKLADLGRRPRLLQRRADISLRRGRHHGHAAQAADLGQSGQGPVRQASNHVAVHHDAAASAGRYNKCLLPKAAFAALTATVSACRTAHYENTVPWDDQGSRLLTVAIARYRADLWRRIRAGEIPLAE